MDDLKCKIIENLKRLDKEKTMLQYNVAALRLDGKLETVSKDIEISEGARNEGNMYYLKKIHDRAIHYQILHYYNQSIAFAPCDSEQLASAYGNRSALLRHIGRYDESICEADKALKIAKSTILQIKLLCRKADCYTALGSPENKKCLEKAKFLFFGAEEPEKTKQALSDLIAKTQLIIDTDKLDKPKENKTRVQAIKMASDVEKKDVWESVKMEYSEKYGKYLVTTRDIEPGEIILVEKPYFNHLNDLMVWMYCSNCLNYLWTVVPCDHCGWRLFCSEKCRDEAMSEYHDMACSVLVQMKENGLLEEHHFVSFLLGVFFKVLKEAGDITQLQVELKAIDDCKDECRKGFSDDGKFEGYRSIYAQPMRKARRKDLEFYGTNAAVALLGLAKYSKLFGRRYNFNEIKKLLKNDTAIFAGALIFKLGLVIFSRLTNIKLPDPTGNLTDPHDNTMATISEDSVVSSSLKSLGFLNIFGCAPNARFCVGYDNRHLMYALQPVKKGTPLITSMCSIYHFIPKPQRQAIYKDFYNRPCECQACKEDWLEKITEGMLSMITEFCQPMWKEIDVEFKSMQEKMDPKHSRANQPDLKLLLQTKEFVKKCWRHYPMPSTTTHKAIRLMMSVYDIFFSPLAWDSERTSSCSN